MYISKENLFHMLLELTHKKDHKAFNELMYATNDMPENELEKIIDSYKDKLVSQLKENSDLFHTENYFIVEFRNAGKWYQEEFESKEDAFSYYLHMHKQIKDMSQYITSVRIFMVEDGLKEEIL